MTLIIERFGKLSIALREERYFVLVGRQPRQHCHVEGPFWSLHDARDHAHQLQLAVYASERAAS